MKTLLFLTASIGCAALVAGCASHRSLEASNAEFSEPSQGSAFSRATELHPVTLTNALAAPVASDSLFTLGPGDTIDIEVIGNAASRAQATVGPDGKIYYSLLPGLDVWGMTLEQAQQAIESQLGKYLTQPAVSVTLQAVGSRYVWVLGRLNRPGIYPLSGPMNLLEAIAMAGGTARSASQTTTAELADLRHSFVVRNGRMLPVDFDRLLRKGDLSQNINLQPDDFIYIPSTLVQEVYVLGAVTAPRAVPYVEPMTLVSAVSGANGPMHFDIPLGTDNGPFTKDAYLSHVAIVRGSVSQPQIAVVDYKAIVKGRAQDVLLEPGDIIFV
ncbi:MAG TPA: polysaccharide biosynthesis/export family protein, partial [Verrucomicrobiae bacterium]|nr:polysaccharide biosynthesis/export family protein [Verrucomicrobiae bacterium]